MARKKNKHIWPNGSITPKCDWHFCKRVFVRYGSRVMAPGECTRIRRRILKGEMTPLHIEYKGNPIFCYKVFSDRLDSPKIYIVATFDGTGLLTALRPKWVQSRIRKERERQRLVSDSGY